MSAKLSRAFQPPTGADKLTALAARFWTSADALRRAILQHTFDCYMVRPMENWCNVVGYEGVYEVSNFGRVKNAQTNKIKTLTIGKADRRPFVALWKNGKQTICRPHSLVLKAFVGPRPLGMEGCHNDGNPQNNHVNNLRWDTTKNNHADKIAHGTTNRGKRCGNAKLTAAQVIRIRTDSRLQRLIAADYGVKPSQISRIKSGVRWGHL
jgi:hypothetical protein